LLIDLVLISAKLRDNNLNIEKVLLRKVTSGSESAFTELYTIWQPILSSFIFKITKSKELTSEVVQDVFLKIWINREALQEVQNFKSFLFVVSKNQAINAFRKSMKELKLFQQLEVKLTSENMELAEDMEHSQLALVDEAIDRLSPRQKEIYLLHRQSKLTYQEIADQLGIGRESVKTHLALAVKSITKYLKSRIILITLIVEILSKNN
jgi:RNA polymerase sigma factor (sigma-70 family)